MHEFTPYYDKIKIDENREAFINLLTWVQTEFNLTPLYKWKIPMFTKDKKFIIGFKAHKNYFELKIEADALEHFEEKLIKAKHLTKTKILRIKWDQDINYELLREIINYKLVEKQTWPYFWKDLPLVINFRIAEDNYDDAAFAINLRYQADDHLYFGSMLHNDEIKPILIVVDYVVDILEEYKLRAWKKEYLRVYNDFDEFPGYWELVIGDEKQIQSSKGTLHDEPGKFFEFRWALIDLAKLTEHSNMN